MRLGKAWDDVCEAWGEVWVDLGGLVDWGWYGWFSAGRFPMLENFVQKNVPKMPFKEEAMQYNTDTKSFDISAFWKYIMNLNISLNIDGQI